METQYINLNMTPTGVTPTFHISQYDVGRVLGFMVYNGSEVVDLDTYTCKVEAERTDGTGITANVSTNDSVGTFSVTATMSNKADKYRGQLVITKNDQRIASLPFIMDVCKAGMDENAESIEEDASLYQQYTNAVQGAIAEANADIQAEEKARIAAVSAEAAARASADSNLQSQINQIVAPSGEAPSAAEVQNARIGADGVTYSTLGDAIRGQVTDLKSTLNDSSLETIPVTLVQGGIDPAVVMDVPHTDRIRTDEYIDFDSFISASVNNDVQLWYFCYNRAKNAIITRSQRNIKYVQKSSINGENIAYIRFVICNNDSTTNITPQATTGFVAHKSIPIENNKKITNEIDEINDKLSSVNGWVRSNTDLNDYQTSGLYQMNLSKANYSTVNNRPPSDLLHEATGCLLQVVHTSLNHDEGIIYQRIINAFPNATQEKIRLIRIGVRTGNEMVWYPWRTEYYSAHRIDELMEGIPKIFRVGSTREYTSLLEGIIAAEQYKNSIVYVDPGTYDAVQEFKDKYGSGYFTSANYTSQENFRGIPLKNGVHIIGYGGVVVTGGLESTDSAEAIEWWSIFNAGDDAGGTNGYGFTLENVTVKILNQYLRCAVHDEYGGVDFDYINKYINCHFIVPQDIIRYCIGGGLGKHGYIVIDGCTVDAPAYAEKTRGINYHNNLDSGSLSEVYVKNSYIPNGTVGITWYGRTPATEKSMLYVNNCYLQHEPIKRAETASFANENVDIVAWNNTIVSNS